MIYRQRGEDTLAAHHLKLAAELGRKTTLVDWLHRWCVAQAQLKEAAGDLEAALAFLEEAKRAYVRSALPDLRPIDAMKARIHLKQGRPDKARAWAEERGLSLLDEVSYLHEFEQLTLVRLEIANPLTNTLLSRLLQAAEAQKRRGSVLDILLVQALAYDAQGNRPQALATLKRALFLAKPEGYISIFSDEGEPMRLLIEEPSNHRDDKLGDYVDKLMAAFIEPAFEPRSAITRQKPNVSEHLSEREMEVLKLLRSELSGPDIARHLFISLNTFRTHTKSIFNKLGVDNRRAAVRRAEELNL
jgi:LuxR family maltose regulon positive regulatory protein